jgi:hypothetical protein
MLTGVTLIDDLVDPGVNERNGDYDMRMAKKSVILRASTE